MKKLIKKTLKIFALIITSSIVLVLISIINFALHIDKHEPKIESEYYSPYYVYSSSKTNKRAKNGEAISILVLPNNTGMTSDNLKTHKKFALLQSYLSHILFKDMNTIILVPVFPRPHENGNIYTQALDRDTMVTNIKELNRLDLQLNAMIDEVKSKYSEVGWKVNEKILMWGHSASGMFVNRYTILHPENVKATAVFSPGGWAIAPIENFKGQELRYPIGIADLNEIAQIDFHKEIYKQIPQLFIIGSNDTNDSVPYSDSYEDIDREIINTLFGETPLDRWQISEKIYKEEMFDVQFITYKGMGHFPSIRALQESVKFLQEQTFE